MKKQSYTLVAAFLFSAKAFSMSSDVADIFDKAKRKLSPPPKDLRSDKPDWDLRYLNGSERVSKIEKKKKYDDLKIGSEWNKEKPVESVDDAIGDESAEEPRRSRSQHRMKSSFSGERNFGVGLVGGGAYGVFGVEFDFAVRPDWSIGFGLGTGMDYSTWGIHSRNFFREGTFSPFLEVGYANWYLRRASPTGEKLRPNFLAGRFFEDGNGKIKDKQRANLIYPGIGVLYQSDSGIASTLQLQYFINMKGFQGGLYGAFGMYYYF